MIVAETLQNIKIQNKNYLLTLTRGKVIDYQKHIETKVKGSGGGTSLLSSYLGNDKYISPIKVSSKIIVHEKIFVIDNQKNEHCFPLKNWDINCRINHKISIVEAQNKNGKSRFILIVYNHNTKTVAFNYKKLFKLFKVSFLWHLLVFHIMLLLISSMTSFLFKISPLLPLFLIIATPFIFQKFRNQKTEQRIKKFTNSMPIKSILSNISEV